MFKSFTVKNFRCFRDLTLAPLERVNLIAGINNVGKTALLEAILIHVSPNSPDLPLRVNIIRGIEQGDVNVQDVWEGLFFDKRTNESVQLTSVDRNDVSRTLQIRLAEPEGAPVVIDESLLAEVKSNELLLEYQDSSGQSGISRAFITLEGIKGKRIQSAPVALRGTLLSTHRRLPVEERFSQLDAAGRQNEVLEVLQLLEPRLQRLAVLVMGNKPVLYGDIGIGELLPLPLMGEGVVRLAAILLVIVTTPGGVVLIDEVENGLHYSVLNNVWKAIANAARRSETQVFATTHSWECIRAAHQAFEESEIYDFRLHRLERINDDIRTATYDQETLSTSVEMNLEVR